MIHVLRVSLLGLCLMALLAAAAIALSQGPPPSSSQGAATGGQTTMPPVRAPEAGQTIFARNCAICHGVDGGGVIGPALAGNRNLGDARYVVARILRGGGGMPPFHPRLSSEQIAAVAGYVRTAWENRFGEVPDRQIAAQWWAGAQTPEALFDRICARCHGADGGGYIGPALVANPRLTSAQYVVAKILNGGGGMPAFHRLLTDEQVATLAGYVRNAWGNNLGPVLVDVVRQQSARAETAGQTGEQQAGGASPGGVQGRLTGASLGDGAAIYGAHCEICHGNRGGGGVAPALAGNAALQDLRYVIARIVMGGGGMVPFNEKLSSADIAAVATYVRTSWGNAFGAVTLAQVQDEHAAGPQQEAPPAQGPAARSAAGPPSGPTRGAPGGGTRTGGGKTGGGAQSTRTEGGRRLETGVLSIRVKPGGARVIVTGPNRYLRFTPEVGQLRLTELAPGGYTVSATKQGYGAASKEVVVGAGETAEVALELPSSGQDQGDGEE